MAQGRLSPIPLEKQERYMAAGPRFPLAFDKGPCARFLACTLALAADTHRVRLQTGLPFGPSHFSHQWLYHEPLQVWPGLSGGCVLYKQLIRSQQQNPSPD